MPIDRKAVLAGLHLDARHASKLRARAPALRAVRAALVAGIAELHLA